MKHKVTLQKEIGIFLDKCAFKKRLMEMYDSKWFYDHDKGIHDTARKDARRVLKRLGKVTVAEFVRASHVWQERLQWTGKDFEYTAGQFYDIELPQAMLAVLEEIEAKRK